MTEVPTNAMLANVPKDYYLAEIEQTISDVRNANTEPGLVFFVCSDIHYFSQIGTYLGTLLKYDSVTDMCVNMKNVAKAIKIDGLVCLGDVVDSNGYTTDETTKQANYVMEQLQSVGLPLIYVMGNHDDNRYVEGEAYSKQELYSMYMSYCPVDRVSDYTFGGLNYYLDYPAYKIRCLIVDENDYYDDNWHYGYSLETVAWFENQLDNIPTGWGVLVFTHRGIVNTNNAGSTMHINEQSMIDAVQSFINGGGNYIATIYGHSHVDFSNTTPWLEISIGSAKVHNTTIDGAPSGSINQTRTRWTATEDLWDVLIVQPNSRTIKTIRFGAGDNRSFTY